MRTPYTKISKMYFEIDFSLFTTEVLLYKKLKVAHNLNACRPQTNLFSNGLSNT